MASGEKEVREEASGRRGNQFYVGQRLGDACEPSGGATSYWEQRAGSREGSGPVRGV